MAVLGSADSGEDVTQVVDATRSQLALDKKQLPQGEATLVSDRTQMMGESSGVEVGPDAELQVVLHYSSGGEEILSVHGKREYLIGRSTKGKGSQADFSVADDHASRRHCRLYWHEDAGWMVEDLGSANGTQLDEEDLIHSMPIHTGSELLIGTTRLRLEFIMPGEAKASLHDRYLSEQPKQLAEQTGIDGEATLVAESSTTVVGSVFEKTARESRTVVVGTPKVAGTQGFSLGELPTGEATYNYSADSTTAIETAVESTLQVMQTAK
jgi:pSer/pThr/pTyr-binding forkhead associated (FHA) protein